MMPIPDPTTAVQTPTRQSIWKRIFLSPSEPRLRAGWRLLIQVAMQLGLTLCLAVALLIPYSLLAGQITNLSGTAFMGFNEAIEILTVTVSVFIARRFLDKRSIASLGLQLDSSTVRDLLVGVGVAGIMMGLIFTIETAAGWAVATGFAWQAEPLAVVVGQAIVSFLVFLVVGWNEELMSRGYHLQTIASGLNLAWGLILSSAVFGVLHLFNPHATWIGALEIAGAGLFLGAAYLWTGRLWLSIGLHLGWNFFEGAVFGFPVSGFSDFYHLIHTTISGPALWTGGAFGPEAGLVLLPALLVGMVLIYLYTHARQAT